MGENEIKEVTEQARKQVPIQGKIEPLVKKEWPATREGTKRHGAQMVIIANEGKPMEEIIKLIMGTIGCSHSEARSHFVYQVKNAIAPGVITTTPGGAGDPANVVIIRKLSPETHRALKARAWSHGRSTEAEIRAILDAAVRPADEIGIGSALAALGRRFRVDELEITRESAPAQPMRFE